MSSENLSALLNVKPKYMFPEQSSQFTYTRTYSRFREDLGRRETWEETVDRYIDFIKEERGDKIPPKVLKKMKHYILSMGVMPSMRALWAAGPAAKADNTTMYNCSTSVIDNPEAFAECLYILMCGTGYGFSVQDIYVNSDTMPVVPTITSEGIGTHKIKDEKAGWADSLKILINSLYQGKNVDFDYSDIRKKGSKLKTMGGRSSGPEPLLKLHNFIRETFYKSQGRKLTALECHDICNEIAEIVVVGGVRRSSQISLSDLHDIEMRNAKVFPFPPRRYMANNSAVYYEKPSAIDFLNEWASLAKSGSGERGIFNLGAARKNSPKRRDASKIVSTNPCQPAFAPILLSSGKQVTFNDIQVGDKIRTGYNKNPEAIVVKKWGNGLKHVYQYILEDHSIFIGTANHRVVIETPYNTNLKMEIEEARKHGLKIKTTNGYYPVANVFYLGEHEVFDITVDNEEHTYITGGVVASNCGEILLRSKEFCNLSEVVIRPEDDLDDLLEKVECATWIGAIQSTFTHFPYLSKEWKENCDEERLLGVSLTGQMDNPTLLTESALKALKARAIKVAKKASSILGINMPAAITCVKPSGTVSQLVNSASGIHVRYAPFYIRRYRISATDPLFKMIKAQGVPLTPENGQENLPEDQVTTWVLSFVEKAPKGAVTRHDVTALDQLEHYKKVQKNWCEHNASCTIYVKDDEWFLVGNWVYENWEFVGGLSFLPYDGGVYSQAPYEEITEKLYNELKAKQVVIDYSKLSDFEKEDNTEGGGTFSCVGDKCELK